MAKNSAGILLYRHHEDSIQFFLVHPGGPFWVRKDEGAWSIPKGEFNESESAFDAAKREFMEETGIPLKAERYIELSSVKSKSGKIIFAWGASGHIDPHEISSNTFDLKMPSGKKVEFPEIDKGDWFSFEEALVKINPAQVALLVELKNKINHN